MNDQWPIAALVVPQPHASLIAAGVIAIITRDDNTRQRGALAIVAAETPEEERRTALADTLVRRHLREAAGIRKPDEIPTGAVVALVELVSTWSTSRRYVVNAVSHPNSELVDFSPDRWAWAFERIRPIRRPIPLHTRQPGVFEIEGRPILDALARQDRATRRQPALHRS